MDDFAATWKTICIIYNSREKRIQLNNVRCALSNHSNLLVLILLTYSNNLHLRLNKLLQIIFTFYCNGYLFGLVIFDDVYHIN